MTLDHEYNGLDLLKRPQVTIHALYQLDAFCHEGMDAVVAQQVETQVKYAGYIARQQDDIARMRQLESTEIPGDFDYAIAKGLSAEVQQALQRVKPTTIGQASRIPGVTPAAMSLLLVYLKSKVSS